MTVTGVCADWEISKRL